MLSSPTYNLVSSSSCGSGVYFMNMKEVARKCAIMLLEVADNQKKWTPESKSQWTRAFNACNKLAGRKIRK